MSFRLPAAGTACAAVLLLAACDDTSGPAPTQAVSISFAAKVNGAAFACGQAYTNIGSTNSSITPTDFRMYVYQVRLTKANGDEVAMTLDSLLPWQSKGIALVDFEDGAPGCPNGTAELHTIVTGTAPKGSYTGIKFTLGLPFDLNHGDPATALSPLDLTEMSWAWQYGYKFLRLDANTTGQPGGWFVHLGSNGCTGTSFDQPPTDCTLPNAAEIVLANLDPTSDTVIADIGALYAAANVDSNTAATAPGCMSDNTDPECSTILPALGVSLVDGSPLLTQSLFTSSAP